jgi:hypothetical protein
MIGMVSEEARIAESDIDDRIRRLPVWNSHKTAILRRLMHLWRDALELAYMSFGHAAMFQNDDSFEMATAIEQHNSIGVFWCIKWAFEYAQPSSRWKPTTEQLVRLTNSEGVAYQALVDALKFATVEGVEIVADADARTLTVYEGGNLSGYDHSIVARDHKSLPFHKQCPLVEDSDQLTKRWTAGEYRAYWRWLRRIAEASETETILAQAGPLAPRQEMFKRPVVFRVPNPTVGFTNIQEDLTLAQQKIDRGMKWKLQYEDCPLIRIGSSTFAISSIVRTLASVDDYMLRVAVLVDREQYDKVSGLREERMVAQSGSALRAKEWVVQPHFHLRDPEREIDVYAARGQQDLVIQLKSTLRPHSPWEVYKRNADVLDGISHTAEVLPRFREGALGFVVTDGYEGDYETWARSLETNVPVATLQDLEQIACDPEGAFRRLKDRAGIKGGPSSEAFPERDIELCEWTIRLVDTRKPA